MYSGVPERSETYYITDGEDNPIRTWSELGIHVAEFSQRIWNRNDTNAHDAAQAALLQLISNQDTVMYKEIRVYHVHTYLDGNKLISDKSLVANWINPLSHVK